MARFVPNNQLYGSGQPGSGKGSGGGGAPPALAEAIRLHDAGVAGDKQAVHQALEILAKLRSSGASSPLAEAYYGSATCLLARDAVDPMVRMNKALEGLKILDQVVQNNPANHQVRSVRGHVCHNLPETYFHRTNTAIEDFNYLISRYEQNKSLFAPQYYEKILYDLGSAYKKVNRTSEAMAVWNKLAAMTRDPKYVQLLRQEGVHVAGGVSPADAAEWKQKKKY